MDFFGLIRYIVSPLRNRAVELLKEMKVHE